MGNAGNVLHLSNREINDIEADPLMAGPGNTETERKRESEDILEIIELWAQIRILAEGKFAAAADCGCRTKQP